MNNLSVNKALSTKSGQACNNTHLQKQLQAKEMTRRIEIANNKYTQITIWVACAILFSFVVVLSLLS